METYFQNDPRIRKWVNQIIDRIFTVCILNGVDSDGEFQKGCQIVMNLTSLLKDIPTLPSEFLADGVKQLIEQQLPDACVMNNFPTFQAIMDRMLREGILKATDTQKKEASNSNSTAVNVKDISTESHDSYTDSPMEVSNIECALAEALAQVNSFTKAGTQANADALAIAEALAQVDTKLEAITKIERYELAKPMSNTNDYLIENALKENNTIKAGTELEPFALRKVPALLTSINSKISQIFSTTQVPQQADLLREVLSNIFPKSTVYWNKRLMGQIFLAQVEDFLICLHDPEHPCNLKKYNKVGWKVLVCSNEDLTFPRRLERKIKQIQRSGKMSATV